MKKKGKKRNKSLYGIYSDLFLSCLAFSVSRSSYYKDLLSIPVSHLALHDVTSSDL